MDQQHKLPIFQVDAFITDRAFSGNPAAMCRLTEPKNEKWMQAVAEEMKLSETAFVCACDNSFELRWFTPAIEEEGRGVIAGRTLTITSGALHV